MHFKALLAAAALLASTATALPVADPNAAPEPWNFPHGCPYPGQSCGRSIEDEPLARREPEPAPVAVPEPVAEPEPWNFPHGCPYPGQSCGRSVEEIAEEERREAEQKRAAEPEPEPEPWNFPHGCPYPGQSCGK